MYGLTPEQYKMILKRQKNKCTVCPTKLSKLSSKEIHIDHNHKTGKVRGILCQKCNLALGLLLESVNIIKSLLNYIGQFDV